MDKKIIKLPQNLIAKKSNWFCKFITTISVFSEKCSFKINYYWLTWTRKYLLVLNEKKYIC